MSQPDNSWLERAELIGGEPCLDFLNSVSDRAGADGSEQIHGYADLLIWLRRCELLGPGDATKLLARARRQPDSAQAALTDALSFRDAAWRLLWASTKGKAAAAGDLAQIECYIKRMRNKTALLPLDGGRFHLVWQGGKEDFDWAMWRTASAMEKFLLSDELSKLRGCAGGACGWLFVDRSRNGMRRWCSMRDCGNRAKARRHYQRVSRA